MLGDDPILRSRLIQRGASGAVTLRAVTDQATRQWLDWAAWVVGPDPAKQQRAAEAAIAAEAAGLSFAEACERAREAAGMPRLRPRLEGNSTVGPIQRPATAIRGPVASGSTASKPAIIVHRAVPVTAVWLALGVLLCIVAAIAYVTVAPTACTPDLSDLRRTFTQVHDAAVPAGNRAIEELNGCSAVACYRAPALQLARAFDGYNAGLRPLCVTGTQQADLNALITANMDVAASARALAAATTMPDAAADLDELSRRLLGADAAARTVEDDLGLPSG